MIFSYILGKFNYKSLLLYLLVLLLLFFKSINSNRNIIENKQINKSNKNAQFNLIDAGIKKSNTLKKNNNCYNPLDSSNKKLIHLILTRFLIEFNTDKEFRNNLYGEKYIRNGFRVISKYLISSLENQSCKDFIWILMLGNKADIEYVKSIMKFKCSFDYRIIINSFVKILIDILYI